MKQLIDGTVVCQSVIISRKQPARDTGETKRVGIMTITDPSDWNDAPPPPPPGKGKYSTTPEENKEDKRPIRTNKRTTTIPANLPTTENKSHFPMPPTTTENSRIWSPEWQTGGFIEHLPRGFRFSVSVKMHQGK
jgi:hypothetical protein